MDSGGTISTGLKPRNSGFHDTALETLLASLGARTLILAGVAGDICVLFTANDAHGRGFRLVVPSDCVASDLFDELVNPLLTNEPCIVFAENELDATLQILGRGRVPQPCLHDLDRFAMSN